MEAAEESRMAFKELTGLSREMVMAFTLKVRSF